MDVPQGIHCPLLAAISTITPLASSQTSLLLLDSAGQSNGSAQSLWPWHTGSCASVCGGKD